MNPLILNMSNKTYHCMQCNKEFLDEDIVRQHHKSTSHEIKEQFLEK